MAVDPDHRRRHHQWHRPLLGLPQFRGGGRVDQRVSPWGIIIGGEELHNNHHTYPTSAKLSVKPYEFDIGWGYIRAMEMLGMAKVRKTAPQLVLGDIKPVADGQTLEAIIANRYEVMANYATEMKRAVRAELERLRKAKGREQHALGEHEPGQGLAAPRRRQDPAGCEAATAAKAVGDSPQLAKLVAMREELRQLWTRTNVSAEQLVADLQAWCKKAEDSGIAALQEFSFKLRAARA
jgi:stearoyl-CoA desaturase (delta-9 desaturase)